MDKALKHLCNGILSFRFYSKSLETSGCSTCGIIVIGDEILKGDVVDINSGYMTSRLHKLGIKVKKITVIGDVLNEISTEVKDFSSRFNYVITTGGIGPTHDDITFEAVAKAFDEPIFLHPDLVKLCQEFYKTSDPNSPGMKLARVPKSARLTFKGETESNVTCVYPNVSVRNVYMFPGIPQLLQKSFDILSSTLFRSSERFYTKTIYFNVTEDKIAGALGSVVQEFPDVFIGSYPKMFDNTYKVKITIESTEENVTTEAYNKLLQIVPKGSVVEPV